MDISGLLAELCAVVRLGLMRWGLVQVLLLELLLLA